MGTKDEAPSTADKKALELVRAVSRGFLVFLVWGEGGLSSRDIGPLGEGAD